MAHLGGEVYTTVKEAIEKSTGDGGLIATFQDTEGNLYWFVNGKPVATSKK
jgi:hypothetical protein